MKIISLFAFTLLSRLAIAQDAADCSKETYTFFTIVDGYHIASCEMAEFKEHSFWIKSATEEVKKAGRYRKFWFDKNEGSTRNVSGQQILANHANAIKKIGGVVLEGTSNVYRASYQGKEIWIELSPSGLSPDEASWTMVAVEIEAMKQEVTALDIAAAVKASGKVAIYGILFDTGKATLSPTSSKAIQEIASYLKANPTVAIFVVGHTDNVGDFSSNISLSRSRAAAVMKELISVHGISADRLTAEGVGPLTPVSTNLTEEGRSLNRRVEVVAK